MSLSSMALSKSRVRSIPLLILTAAISLLHPILGDSLAALGVISCMGAALALITRTSGLFSPFSVIVGITAFYTAAPAAGIITNAEVQRIEPALYFGHALPLCVLYLATIIIVYAFGGWRGEALTSERMSFPVNRRMVFCSLICAVGSVAYLISIYFDVGLAVANLSRAEQQIALSTRSHILLVFSSAGVLYCGGTWLLARRFHKSYSPIVPTLTSVGLAIFSLTSVLILGDRRVFLATVAAILTLGALSRRSALWIALAALPAYLAFAMYSGLRGLPVHEWSGRLDALEVSRYLDPSQGEFGAWARIAQDVLSQKFSDISRLTVLEAPFAVIPSAIFPDRPLAPSLWYAAEFTPNIAMQGGAWAFSIVVESFMNFWYAGPVVFGFFVGSAIGKFQKRAITRMFMVFALVFSFRSDLVSLIQQAGWMFAFIGVYAVLGRGVQFR